MTKTTDFYTDSTSSACLPSQNIEHGENCWSAGWDKQNKFLEKHLKSVSTDYCHWTSHYSSIQPNEFCAGLPDQGSAIWDPEMKMNPKSQSQSRKSRGFWDLLPTPVPDRDDDGWMDAEDDCISKV